MCQERAHFNLPESASYDTTGQHSCANNWPKLQSIVVRYTNDAKQRATTTKQHKHRAEKQKATVLRVIISDKVSVVFALVKKKEWVTEDGVVADPPYTK